MSLWREIFGFDLFPPVDSPVWTLNYQLLLQAQKARIRALTPETMRARLADLQRRIDKATRT